ncbi:MAG TPA: hypothetical protein VM938_09430 [Acidimicrobiales bacterium]|nr:hypothetical protein [Acidimicrobiales bacterium]
MRRWSAAILVAMVTGACNGNSAVIPKGEEYEAAAMVLEAEGHGPVLCLGPILASLPPGCGGPPVRNWHWAKAPQKETQAGVTWADVNLRGTWDGHAFTVTAVLDHPPAAGTPSSGASSFPPACPTPEAIDPTASFEEWGDPGLQSDPDVAALWVTYEPRAVNVVVRPGAGARVKEDIRRTFPGPLCLVERDQKSRTELRTIQHRLTERLGSQFLSGAVDEVRGQVVVEVIVADPARQAELDREFSAGVVRLTGRLQPVSRNRPPHGGGG